MQSLDIYRGSDLYITIKPDDSSAQTKAIMGVNSLSITFEDSRFINFLINDYATVFGENYIITQPVVITKSSKYFYKYSMVLDSEGSTLARAQFLFLGADNSLRETDFSLMGNCRDFLNLIVQNAGRIGIGWTAGQYPLTEYKNLTFSKDNCYNVLGRIAETFETEFWVENKTIHFAKLQNDTGHTFKQGRYRGLYDVTRLSLDNSSVATRLYVYGSEKNLPPDYRSYSKRLRMTDGNLFMEKNTDKYGVIEYTQIFEDVWPTRTGRVTSVNASNPYVFIDTSMDFDINSQLLPGLPGKVVFNTGQLAGYEFQITKYDSGSKEFTIVKNKDERILEVPNALLKPAIGDEYVLVDIILPQPYIDAAEARLLSKAQEFLDIVSEPQLKYQIIFDPVYLRVKNIVPKAGDLVWLIDQELEVQKRIRITSITRNLVNEFDIKVELADSISSGKIDIIVNGQVSTDRQVSSIEKQIQNTAVLNNKVVGDLVIEQGTAAIKNIPETATLTGYSQLIIENSTGKIFKKV